tara:strand:- start:4388 stop:5128 length:741 start_codon:yes stop_codon:yes gene_type:complete
VNFLVIGDSCIDVFVYGKCDRLAPAAPVPVFVSTRETRNMGMAGNVYQNILSLGSECDLVTNKAEITKTRFVEDKTNHMLLRLDSDEGCVERIQNIDKIEYEKYDAIVISDYDKGFLTESDIEYISQQHEYVFLDTKKVLGEWARHVTYIKINEVEYQNTKHTLGKWCEDSLIVTLGSRGCQYQGKYFPVTAVEIRDLIGAGDTFLASLVYNFIKRGNIYVAIDFANECATQVVQQRGVNTARWSQ